MPRFIVFVTNAQLFEQPDFASPHKSLPLDTVVDGDPAAPGSLFLKVTVASPAAGAAGFVLNSQVRADAPLRPEPVPDGAAVCLVANDVARLRGVDRDYLMAAAWASSNGLTDLGVPGDGGIGPYRFSRDAWLKALADPAAMALGLSERDRADWTLQVTMAALTTLRLDARLTAALGRPPTLGEIYFGQVAGEDTALTLLPGDHAVPFGDAQPGSVQDVLTGLSRKLDDGYVKAAAVIDQQASDVRFFHAEDGDPPWLMVAREEAFRGVFEFPGADNNARITEYLAVSGLAGSADEVPWCGAFVAFCMKRSGDAAAAASIPRDAARAASWLDWGTEAPPGARPAGTVVVLKPQTDKSSGHVGFLVEPASAQGTPPGKIRLLAGNQGSPQRVGTVDYDADQVADHGFRQAGAAAPPASVVAPGATVFGSLVPGGFFSTPDSKKVRSIRTNNPGALNFLAWQAARKGYAGQSLPDNSADHNVTTIYRTPEHGIASWFHLLTVRYGFGDKPFALRTLAQKYAGSRDPANIQKYLKSWVEFSNGHLTPASTLRMSDDKAVMNLAQAMFRLEAGEPTPVKESQILFAIAQERAGTLPD